MEDRYCYPAAINGSIEFEKTTDFLNSIETKNELESKFQFHVTKFPKYCFEFFVAIHYESHNIFP